LAQNIMRFSILKLSTRAQIQFFKRLDAVD